MRLLLATVGRLKDGAECELFDRYAERLDAAGRALALGPLHLIEVPESRAATAELRKSDEARRLLEAAERADLRVALDAHGKAQSSEAFAKWISKKRDDGTKALAFLIGGPDGHGAAALEAASLTLSLGPMTLPHGLARIMLAEQLYRAATILAGHPYHRG
ncbi:MAG TPA: 23S rRNA (pseudouridine(1915)-N(3))-methyltransferase RlmH [Hyphomicrobiaceae bacterium]|nr:23S rRNA (pseudouridine(1915)-N(3))-methyltransferase RlmH [Hyphomicrobiaceae bacterium]